MTPNYLKYPLNDGFVDHWLIYGPLAAPVEGINHAPINQPSFKADIAQRLYDPAPGIDVNPLENGFAFVTGGETAWKYYRCREDHLVDIGADYLNWHHVSVYAYAELRLQTPWVGTVSVEANGPVDVWINGQAVFHGEDFTDKINSYTFTADFQESNQILVRTRQVGVTSCLNLMRFKLAGLDPTDPIAIEVFLPTKARHPSRFQELEANLEKAHLEEIVNFKGAKFNLHWAEGTSEDFHFHYQVQDDQERIYVEGTWQPETAGTDIGHTVRLFERPFRIVLKAPPREYYELNNRYQRAMPLYVLDTLYASKPAGSYATRRREALQDAGKHESNLFGQIALIAAGHLDEVKEQVFRTAGEAVQRKEAGSEVLLLGMLGTALRGAGVVELSAINAIVQEAAAAYSSQAAVGLADPNGKESHQIVTSACNVLVGQLLGMDSLSGAGEQESVAWIQSKGREGFQAWLSNSEMEWVISALAHLTSLAKDNGLRELAAVLLDKVLFELAVHTYQGAFASAHSVTEAGMLKSAQLEATSGISRMLYGMGVYNPHITGLVSLAVADYEFPTFFAEIAADRRDEMLSLENQAGTSIVTLRTPDFMLSSAQDWRAGQPGNSELVWQGTLGPDTMVFTTHPACMSEAPARRPGHWLGNAVLPRVAQWKDTLIAVYNFGEEGMNFTHAFFPVHQFDEYVLRDGWAFARKGEGYLALTAARGLEFVKEGPGGYRELRSYGTPNIWICQMGRAATDESFADFQAKNLATRLEWPGNSVKMANLRGEKIEFGWENALVVNGVKQDLVFGKSIENPYCTAALNSDVYEISWQDTVMRLNFN